MAFAKLWKNYAPIIVLVPAIVGIHYGWYKLQQNERLVAKDQQLHEQPIVSAAKKFYNYSKDKLGVGALPSEK